MGFPQETDSAPAITQGERDTTGAMGIALALRPPTSVIIPALNEAENIAALLLRLDQAMKLAAIPYEAIVVDDRSTDDTAMVAEATAQEHALPVRVLTKQGPPGKSIALMEGFATAQYDALAMIDGDLQYPPEALVAMNHQLEKADLIVADRRASYSNADQARGRLSHIFTLFVTMLFSIDTDMQSGMKMFQRKVYMCVMA
jgi:glycosyltransferase involved in cell wall biosynthesis